MDDFLKMLPSLGVGGVLAGMMFFFYRKDMLKVTEQWQGQTEILVTVVRENSASNASLISSNASLAAAVDALHRRLDGDRVPSSWGSPAMRRDQST